MTQAAGVLGFRSGTWIASAHSLTRRCASLPNDPDRAVDRRQFFGYYS